MVYLEGLVVTIFSCPAMDSHCYPPSRNCDPSEDWANQSPFLKYYKGSQRNESAFSIEVLVLECSRTRVRVATKRREISVKKNGFAWARDTVQWPGKHEV